ncbi:rCG26672 [Rattus norvegicus]|uniref:RCG26672 n=1 Tax=Rattus norvegicus TaxID=10116 RepID=A6HLT4_RAT|nr:rCG26672 [Rattus norvegicus]
MTLRQGGAAGYWLVGLW